MAITSYSELRTAIANWLARDDLAARIPEFIALVEADLNRNPDFRLRFMESRATSTLVSGSGFLGLPADFLELRNVHLETNPRTQLQFVTPAQLTESWLGSQSGTPAVFTVIGDELRFAPVPDTAYEVRIDYYAGLSDSGPATKPADQKPLSDGNASNWVLAAAPDVYLYGALATAAPFLDQGLVETGQLQATQRAYGVLYQRAVGKAIAADRRSRVFGGPLRMRSDRISP